MERKIIKVGDSSAVTIPSSLFKKLKLNLGDSVEISDNDGKIIIEKKRQPISEEDQFLLDLHKSMDKHAESLRILENYDKEH
ncbi:AbrB/MazE/SpoVT family DNA-binding domain-containing protein [Companilactobacillus mishanensis]|uniref:AbrB/MazE/SpoVT family DNA-binding domain-containing protein n=1 Tax=Companilactobacillus mishanensis TaxID=2486008 RepID=A0A5P0ZIR1_9LACO|nr:AbrB/MazE/SpoVT family DNA-binding domain-containing protein [Companilactobacillus mishanensis]MQS52979.1 AbrB/MazE/SpoVT family DNA-binding domain-containing protein [Companilactobacillus mishanensis]